MNDNRPVWPWALGGAAAILVVVGLIVGGFMLGRGGGTTDTPQAATVTTSPPPSITNTTTTTTTTEATPTPAPIVTVTATPKPQPSKTASSQNSTTSGEQLFSLNPDSDEFAVRADAILCSGQYLPEVGISDSPVWPVLIAQRQLNRIYPSDSSDPNNITVNGIFGPITQRQTARFQYDSYATVTGAVGSETWQRLRDIRCNGAAVPEQRVVQGTADSAVADQLCSWRDYPTVSSSQGTPEQVALLQAALAGRGYDPGPIDGVFGSQTESALRAYQARRQMVVDGVAGTQTWQSLQVSYCDPG